MAKQTLTITIDAPKGYKVVDFRPPKKGELIASIGSGVTPFPAEPDGRYWFIFEKLPPPEFTIGELDHIKRCLRNSCIIDTTICDKAAEIIAARGLA